MTVFFLLYCLLQSPDQLKPTTASRPSEWQGIRYLGGAIETPNRMSRWKNALVIAPDSIEIRLEPGSVIRIQPTRVTSLTWLRARHPTGVGTVVATALLTPLILTGPLVYAAIKDMASGEHLITIEYTLPDDRVSAVLLHVRDKDDVGQIIESLIYVTGKPVQAI